MQVRVDWVLRIFGTQVFKKKRPIRPVFPDYLSVSYDYAVIFEKMLKEHEASIVQKNQECFTSRSNPS